MVERQAGLASFADASRRPEDDLPSGGLDLWCIDTVNPTGWRATLGYLQHTAADAVCIQEHRRCSDEQCAEAAAAARAARWSLSVGRAVTTDAGGASAGVAIAARSHFGLGLPVVAPTCADLTSRLRVARCPGVVRGGIHVVPAYFWTPQPLTSCRNRALADALMVLLDAVDGPWVVAADWQVPPDELTATGLPERVGGVVVAPSVPTCGKHTLDYFVVSRALAHVVVGAQAVANSGTKLHLAARLVLASAGRSRLVRKVKGPRVLRALLEGPRGPDTPQPAPPTCATLSALDVAYSEWISALEKQALPFLAVDGAAAAAVSGRANGHTVVWRCGLGPPRSPTAFGCAAMAPPRAVRMRTQSARPQRRRFDPSGAGVGWPNRA